MHFDNIVSHIQNRLILLGSLMSDPKNDKDDKNKDKGKDKGVCQTYGWLPCHVESVFP